MDLIQVILPQPSEFRILLSDDEEVRIIGYENINVEFCDRVVFRNNERQDVKSPMITYQLILDSKSKTQLKTIFTNHMGARSCLQTRAGRIKVGRDGYIFNVEITGKQDMEESYFSYGRDKDTIKVCLKLENTHISLFDRADEAYEKYSRFDILDL